MDTKNHSNLAVTVVKPLKKEAKTMKKSILSSAIMVIVAFTANAQKDTIYIWKSGAVIKIQPIVNIRCLKTTDVDSITFYKPIPKSKNINISLVSIPSGTFTMGSPADEVNHEIEHQVRLSAFQMSKYEITNMQFAAFLNAKGIGSDGKDVAGTYPTEALIYASDENHDWGLHYTNGKWIPVTGYEKNPVINVTWYGASEFATYVGCELPTESQWEYACRANTTTAYNTGACLSNTQANYSWDHPQTGCTNTNTKAPGTTQPVGSYPANAFGLYDMHGNVWEWCSDWFNSYPTSAQTNPKGSASGSYRVFRGGSWYYISRYCRSAFRNGYYPNNSNNSLGFRIVLGF